MFPKAMFLIGSLMCIGLFGYTSATYGEKCTTDSDCTAADHTTCQTVHENCPSKGCTGCATGYEMNHAGTACVASIGTACTDVDADCIVNGAGNGACTGSACACAGSHTYDTTYRACVPDAKKKFGAACSVETDCHVPAASDGACTGGVCACASGFIKGDSHVCRAPIYDEACVSAGEACVKSTADSSDNDPTCTNSKCQCASNQDKTTFLGITACLTAKTDTIGNGLKCTTHNECTSKFCYSCPGTAADSICVGASDNSAIGAVSHPLLMLVLALIAGVMKL